MSNPIIKYYYKEDTNQILVSGSDDKDVLNSYLTSSKNASTIFNPNLTAKISSLGLNSSYVVQNGDDTTTIPIADNQELWVYRGYNQDGGTDGDTYRYNPFLHRAYKAYILTETGSGMPTFPYLPEGPPVAPLGIVLPGKFLATTQSTSGNLSSGTNPQAYSGSFKILNGSRDIHPFAFTQYVSLADAPAAGSQIFIYQHGVTSSFEDFNYETSTSPTGIGNNGIRFNNATPASVTEVYLDSKPNLDSVVNANSESLQFGFDGGNLVTFQDSDPTNSITFNILTASRESSYNKIIVDNVQLGAGYSAWSANDTIDFRFEDYTNPTGTVQQSQGFSGANLAPQTYDSITLETGNYSFSSSGFADFGTQGQFAIGETIFGLYSDLDYFAKYKVTHGSLSPYSSIRIFYTSSDINNPAKFFDISAGKFAIFDALVGTVSQSGYNGTETFNDDSTFSSNDFIVEVVNSSRPTANIPPDIFSTRWNDVYISFSSSLSSSLDGLYIFNQLPQNDVQVTASMFVTAWTGSDDSGAKYGNADYGTDVYGDGEAGDGPTWQTASIRIYTGSFPDSVPTIDNDFVTESAFMSTDFHISGQAITMSYLIPSESVSIKDCLSISLAVSSGSANSASVENSLVVPSYQLEIKTDDERLFEGDGLVPTFIDNAFSGSQGFSNAPDCQPILNNVALERENRFQQIVNYSTGIYQPLNFQAILSGSARKSTVPLSNYTTLPIIYPRYLGSRTTANDVNQPPLGSSEGYQGQYGYGSLPVIDYQRAYFGYAQQVTDPYPVINNKVQFNLKYLIDDSGNALQPNLSPYTAFDVEEVWDEGGIARVGMNQITASTQYNLIDGYQPVFKVAKEAVPIIYSQTSSVGYSNFIPIRGADQTDFEASFLQYGYTVQGLMYTETNASQGNQSSTVKKEIILYNVLANESTTILAASSSNAMTFSSASRFGNSGSDTGTVFASQSFVLSTAVGNPGSAPNQSGSGGIQYAAPGELYFNEDRFALNGDDGLSVPDLSSAYTLKMSAKFPSTVPKDYRTDAGGTWDSSDYEEGVVGDLTIRFQYSDSTNLTNSGSDNNWTNLPLVVDQNPSMTFYFVDGSNSTIDLAATLGNDVEITNTKLKIKLNQGKIKNALNGIGKSRANTLYCTVNISIMSSNSTTFISKRRYRVRAFQDYKNESVDPPRNYWNPKVRPQHFGGATLNPQPKGPIVNYSLVAGQVDPLSDLEDNALNEPYWIPAPSSSIQNDGNLIVGSTIQQDNSEPFVQCTNIVSAELTNSDYTVQTSISDTTPVTTGNATINITSIEPFPGTKFISYGTISVTAGGFSAGNIIKITDSTLDSFGFGSASDNLMLLVTSNNITAVSPLSVLMLSSSLGNETYNAGFIPADLTYDPGENVRFPGGFEPADTAFPKYDLEWNLEIGDEIRFENDEASAYTIQRIIPPAEAVGGNFTGQAVGRLQIYLDRDVPASTNTDFFMIRRYIPSPTVIYIDKLFPYGSLPSKKEFIPNQNSITLNAPTGSAGTVATGSVTTTTTSGSIVSVYNPLLKSDNLPSAFIFPEYPTAEIELDPDKALQDLRDKKLID